MNNKNKKISKYAHLSKMEMEKKSKEIKN